MLLIVHPPTYQAERRYIYDVIFKEFLGVEYQTLEDNQDCIHIMLSNNPNGPRVMMPDVMFSTPKESWLLPDSLPKQPLDIFDISETRIEATLVSSKIPVIYGRRGKGDAFFSEDKSELFLGLDIFGSAFFMLTRYEELVIKERDDHGRFSATTSLAFKEGFLQRPIINEYLEILWWALKWLDLKMERKQREYSVSLTHDVDWPMTDSRGVRRALKSAIADIIRRKEPSLALKRLKALPFSGVKKFNHDVNNTFDYIMRISEAHNIRSVFNMIACNSNERIDGNYSLDDPWIQGLLSEFQNRGHNIGLHLSYNSFCDKEQTIREFKYIVDKCAKLNIDQQIWGTRQHFLRFNNPATWQNMEDARIAFDSTLTYADRPGFRCGVCYEYPVFNLRTRNSLKLHERPLIVMDGTLFNYMDLSYESAAKKIVDLSKKCRLFDGEFILLWHNCALITKQSRHWYEQIIREICSHRSLAKVYELNAKAGVGNSDKDGHGRKLLQV